MTDEQTEKLLAQAEQEWANQLPPWAERLAIPDEMAVGTQLSTRDGRKIGNAWIVEKLVKWGMELYIVRTDAGNTVRCNILELDAYFYPPKYVGRLEEINKKFLRIEDRE